MKKFSLYSLIFFVSLDLIIDDTIGLIFPKGLEPQVPKRSYAHRNVPQKVSKIASAVHLPVPTTEYVNVPDETVSVASTTDSVPIKADDIPAQDNVLSTVNQKRGQSSTEDITPQNESVFDLILDKMVHSPKPKRPQPINTNRSTNNRNNVVEVGRPINNRGPTVGNSQEMQEDFPSNNVMENLNAPNYLEPAKPDDPGKSWETKRTSQTGNDITDVSGATDIGESKISRVENSLEAQSTRVSGTEDVGMIQEFTGDKKNVIFQTEVAEQEQSIPIRSKQIGPEIQGASDIDEPLSELQNTGSKSFDESIVRTSDPYMVELYRSVFSKEGDTRVEGMQEMQEQKSQFDENKQLYEEKPRNSEPEYSTGIKVSGGGQSIVPQEIPGSFEEKIKVGELESGSTILFYPKTDETSEPVSAGANAEPLFPNYPAEGYHELSLQNPSDTDTTDSSTSLSSDSDVTTEKIILPVEEIAEVKSKTSNSADERQQTTKYSLNYDTSNVRNLDDRAEEAEDNRQKIRSSLLPDSENVEGDEQIQIEELSNNAFNKSSDGNGKTTPHLSKSINSKHSDDTDSLTAPNGFGKKKLSEPANKLDVSQQYGPELIKANTFKRNLDGSQINPIYNQRSFPNSKSYNRPDFLTRRIGENDSAFLERIYAEQRPGLKENIDPDSAKQKLNTLPKSWPRNSRNTGSYNENLNPYLEENAHLYEDNENSDAILKRDGDYQLEPRTVLNAKRPVSDYNRNSQQRTRQSRTRNTGDRNIDVIRTPAKLSLNKNVNENFSKGRFNMEEDDDFSLEIDRPSSRNTNVHNSRGFDSNTFDYGSGTEIRPNAEKRANSRSSSKIINKFRKKAVLSIPKNMFGWQQLPLQIPSTGPSEGLFSPTYEALYHDHAKEKDLSRPSNLLRCMRDARKCQFVPELHNLCFLDCLTTRAPEQRVKRWNTDSAVMWNKLIDSMQWSIHSLCTSLNSASIDIMNLMQKNPGSSNRPTKAWLQALGTPPLKLASINKLANTLVTFIIENSNTAFTALRTVTRELDVGNDFSTKSPSLKLVSEKSVCKLKNSGNGFIGASGKLMSLFEQNKALVDVLLPGYMVVSSAARVTSRSKSNYFSYVKQSMDMILGIKCGLVYFAQSDGWPKCEPETRVPEEDVEEIQPIPCTPKKVTKYIYVFQNGTRVPNQEQYQHLNSS